MTPLSWVYEVSTSLLESLPKAASKWENSPDMFRSAYKSREEMRRMLHARPEM